MNYSELQKLDKHFVMQTYNRFPVAIERGDNATLYDFEGRAYIDFTSGIGVCSVGHCNPRWIAAVEEQAKKLCHISNLFYSEPGTKLAELLCKLSSMRSVFFSNSGAEANEGAIKLARKYSYDKYGKNRHTIITLQQSFHGRTVTTLSATGQEKFHDYFFPFTEGFKYVPADDIEAMKEAMTSDVCAVMLECIQGEGGVIPIGGEYLREVEKLCNERDILLIVDEVQTGVGRTGKMFLSRAVGLSPDIITLAKGLGGGLPIGAVLANEKCKDVLTPGTHAGTYGANPICCAAALTVLGIVEKELKAVYEKGAYIRAALSALNLPKIKGTRGMGLMIGVIVEDVEPAQLVREFLDEGLLTLTAGADVVRLMPPLTATYKEIDDGLTIIQTVLSRKKG